MPPLEHPDRIQIAFDDHRLVNNAEATLAQLRGVEPASGRRTWVSSPPMLNRSQSGMYMMYISSMFRIGPRVSQERLGP